MPEGGKRGTRPLIEGELPASYREVYEEFSAYLAMERGASDNTLEGYLRDIRRYCAYLAGDGVDDLADVRRQEITAYLEVLAACGFAPLFIRHPFDCLILYCANSDDPIDLLHNMILRGRN